MGRAATHGGLAATPATQVGQRSAAPPVASLSAGPPAPCKLTRRDMNTRPCAPRRVGSDESRRKTVRQLMKRSMGRTSPVPATQNGMSCRGGDTRRALEAHARRGRMVRPGPRVGALTPP